MKLFASGPGLDGEIPVRCVQKYKVPEISRLALIKSSAKIADGYGLPINTKSSLVSAGFPLIASGVVMTPLFTRPLKTTVLVAGKVPDVGAITAYPFPGVIAAPGPTYCQALLSSSNPSNGATTSAYAAVLN